MDITNAPATAVGFPFFPVVASSLPVIISQAQACVDHDNQQAKLIVEQGYENWLLANTLNREKGLPIQPKPEAPLSRVLHVERDQFQTTWLWITFGARVAPPCPDLPPLPPTPPAGNISIGRNIAFGWWAALYDDTAPDAMVFTVPPSAFNVPPGTYRKVMSPFGGWWNKVA